MPKTFEDRFFELWQTGLDEFKKDVRSDIQDMSREVKDNTKSTDKLSGRVDKLDKKVFGKKPSSLANIFGDKQIVAAFALSLLVFLTILASILHIRIPQL